MCLVVMFHLLLIGRVECITFSLCLKITGASGWWPREAGVGSVGSKGVWAWLCEGFLVL